MDSHRQRPSGMRFTIGSMMDSHRQRPSVITVHFAIMCQSSDTQSGSQPPTANAKTRLIELLENGVWQSKGLACRAMSASEPIKDPMRIIPGWVARFLKCATGGCQMVRYRRCVLAFKK